MTYYIWSHTIEHEKNRIVDEKLKGYSSAQFLIDKSKPSKWLIKVNYRGNKSYDPTYLKVAIYYNYGMPTQRREVKVYRLELKNVNQTLLQIQNN